MEEVCVLAYRLLSRPALLERFLARRHPCFIDDCDGIMESGSRKSRCGGGKEWVLETIIRGSCCFRCRALHLYLCGWHMSLSSARYSRCTRVDCMYEVQYVLLFSVVWGLDHASWLRVDRHPVCTVVTEYIMQRNQFAVGILVV